jgi:NAD(P)-dependent dehydrogenase (short-subunit alcohol dehydrogenase family)
MEQRVVIVGASTGLGRCLGTGLADRGVQVALLARRRDKLDDAVSEAGGRAVGIECDAIDPESCRAAIDAAAAAMGGIDSVVYAAAVGPLVKLEDATPEQWTWAFSTNVVGASNVTQAALPHVKASGGTVFYLSTTGASYTAPWSGLGVYQVTKAAMNRLVDHWHVEQPGVGFTLVTVGECPGGEGDRQTQFNVDWGKELVGQVAGDWFNRALLSGAFIDVEHLTDQFHALVTAGRSLQVRSMVIIPKPPVAAG